MLVQHLHVSRESNNLLYDLQHGFRHSRSCETQLLSFVQEIAANSDKNIQTDLIIMDFATGAISDDSPSRTTVCVRFDKKAEIQVNV
jgi:hypothetical protein